MRIKNELGLPQPFIDAVSREYQYKDKQYSVTSLLKGICQTLLERRHHDKVEQDVADMVWMIFGSAVHSILENAQETDNQLKENWLCVECGEYKLSGIFDLYDDELKKVTDYKTGSTWKVIYNEWDDYHKQLLMYAWMLRKIGFDCRQGEIVMMLKDWSSTKAKLDASYPQHPVYIKKFNFNDKDIQDIERYIYSRFNAIKQLESVTDDELPPCTADERWQEPTKYAVKKKGNKRAIKLYDNEQDAKNHCDSVDGLEIEVRHSEPKKCNEYCSVNGFCKFYQDYLKGKNND